MLMPALLLLGVCQLQSWFQKLLRTPGSFLVYPTISSAQLQEGKNWPSGLDHRFALQLAVYGGAGRGGGALLAAPPPPTPLLPPFPLPSPALASAAEVTSKCCTAPRTALGLAFTGNRHTLLSALNTLCTSEQYT